MEAITLLPLGRNRVCVAMDQRFRRLTGMIAGALLLVLTGTAPVTSENVWTALRSGGAVGLMRHAVAPGATDPANFKLNKCSTQRNLSAAGRAQAKRIGSWFRKNGIVSANVLTSAFCRCQDTARLLGLGGARTKAWLNALAKETVPARKQMAGLAAFIRSAKPGKPAILVTHKWNIARLVGITPGSGETVVVRAGSDGKISVIGRIPAR